MTAPDTALREGADAFVALMDKITDLNVKVNDDGDVEANYPAIVAAIETSIEAHVALMRDPAHRAGWLRAAAVAFRFAVTNGCVIDENWD